MKFFRSIDCSFLLTNCDASSWSFVVLKGTQVWEGLIKNDEIEKSASDVHQSVAEYTEAMKSIFSGQTKEFILDLKIDDDTPKELSWKKVTESGVKFSLGNVSLKISQTIGIDGVLKELAAFIVDLSQNLDSCKQQLDDAKAFSKGLTEKLELLSHMKSQLESELFAKFVLILNEKKEKIRSLKREIALLKNEVPPSAHSAVDTVSNSPDENKQAQTDGPSSKITGFSNNEIDASFISKLPKRQTKRRVSNKTSSPTNSKRSRTQSNYEVSSDDDEVDADELVADL